MVLSDHHTSALRAVKVKGNRVITSTILAPVGGVFFGTLILTLDRGEGQGIHAFF